MIDLWCNVPTNLDNAYFPEDEDRDFVDWLEDQLYKELDDIVVEVEDPELEGVSKITASVNEFFDNDHCVVAVIAVETSLSEDDFAERDDIFEYVENTVMADFVKQFNDKCKIIVPVTNQDTFDDFGFDGEDFYVKCYKAGNGFKAEDVKTLTVQLTSEYEVEF